MRPNRHNYTSERNKIKRSLDRLKQQAEQARLKEEQAKQQAIIDTNVQVVKQIEAFVRAGGVLDEEKQKLLTASLEGTASYAVQALSSSFAATASSADNFTVRGTLTAQTIVAQVITSSTELITGSFTVSGSLNALGGVTGSLLGTASYANNSTTASAVLASSSLGKYLNKLLSTCSTNKSIKRFNGMLLCSSLTKSMNIVLSSSTASTSAFSFNFL